MLGEMFSAYLCLSTVTISQDWCAMYISDSDTWELPQQGKKKIIYDVYVYDLRLHLPEITEISN